MATKIPAPRSRRISVRTPTYHSVRRSRRRSSGDVIERSWPEAIAGAAQRGDQLRLEAVVDLPAQAADQHLEDVAERVVVVVPDVRRDRGAIDHLSRASREQLEQREFLGRERDGAARPPDFTSREVHLEVGDAPDGGCERERAPPGKRVETRDELVEGERLGEIVVGARL